MRFEVPENTFFALNVSHSFRFERSEDAVIWQFNKEFYCIITHDAEVSCTGLLFYGWREAEPILLDEKETRSLGLLVENNFKKLHQVQDYANLMFKSPKTLSNLFAKYSEKSPVQLIADRLFLKSKRLILYTDKSTGEIGFELGFGEPAHFSRFFKKMSGVTVSDFRKSIQG